MKFQVHFLFVVPARPANTVAAGSHSGDDIGDAAHRAPAAVLDALADMPRKGHGVLIAPQWVVTCAHNVASTAPAYVTIGGLPREVDKVVVHPGYRTLPKPLVDAAMVSGDAGPVMAFLAAADDVALLRLRQPIMHIHPVRLHLGSNEVGETIALFGNGAQPRTVLRHGPGLVTSADHRWMVYRFDRPKALALDDVMGSRDDGAPAPAVREGQWQLAGLAAWREVRGDMRKPGRYGDNGVGVRLSRYAQWLRDVMATN